MEPEFDQPMTFDESKVLDQPAAVGAEIGSWGYGVQVYGVARGTRERRKLHHYSLTCVDSPLRRRCRIWGSICRHTVTTRLSRCQVTGCIASFCLKVLVTLLVTGVVKWLVTLIDPESFYWLPWWSLCTDSCLLSLQVDLSGNCLFGALKRSLTVCNNSASGRDAPYFPNCYFQRQVVNYIINHRCPIYHNKYEALMSLYGVEGTDPSRDWNLPLSFKQYLRWLLKKSFWGDKIVLYAVSCMWRLKITILNTKTLQEYRIQHDRTMDHANTVLTFSNNHFNATGK